MQTLKKYKTVIIVISILLVGYNLFDKFYYPELTNKGIEETKYQSIVYYQYWHEKEHDIYDENESQKYIEERIIKKTNDQRLLNIFLNMKKDQNITITKNVNNNNIYIFTNSHKYKSEITVYRDDGIDLVKEKTIHIIHLYKVGYGEYDEDNQKIYLGVIRARLDEGGFLSNWINGNVMINLEDCYIEYSKGK